MAKERSALLLRSSRFFSGTVHKWEVLTHKRRSLVDPLGLMGQFLEFSPVNPLVFFFPRKYSDIVLNVM